MIDVAVVWLYFMFIFQILPHIRLASFAHSSRVIEKSSTPHLLCQMSFEGVFAEFPDKRKSKIKNKSTAVFCFPCFVPCYFKFVFCFFSQGFLCKQGLR
ncbi:unnamed protein product [Lactuca virosa]|uniref:Secreted protein n=1 Tax=Lactuca virosa TaxID=75947 RepID=A0AAU9MQU8_9ASTR|nr:unnamed protein product [Lactuca virosa]